MQFTRLRHKKGEENYGRDILLYRKVIAKLARRGLHSASCCEHSQQPIAAWSITFWINCKKPRRDIVFPTEMVRLVSIARPSLYALS